MKVSLQPVCLKNVFNACVGKSSKTVRLPEPPAVNLVSGADILAKQNRTILLKQAENYIEPLKKQFKSTKEMFDYARQRCLDGIKENYEHVVLMDIKKNIVIAEFKGIENKCSVKGLEDLILDEENTVLMHGHPIDYPISSADLSCLKNYKISQIIAIDKDNEFSLVSKKYKPKNSESKGIKQYFAKRKKEKKLESEYIGYRESLGDCNMFCKNPNREIMHKRMVDSILKEYTPRMDMRYITNYSYLRQK